MSSGSIFAANKTFMSGNTNHINDENERHVFSIKSNNIKYSAVPANISAMPS